MDAEQEYHILMGFFEHSDKNLSSKIKFTGMWPQKGLYHRISFQECIQVSVCDGIFFTTLVAIYIHSHTLVLLFSLSWYSVLMLKRVQQETLPPSVEMAGQYFVDATLRQEPRGAATLSSFPSFVVVVVFLLLPDLGSQPRNWLLWHIFHGFPQALQKTAGKVL